MTDNKLDGSAPIRDRRLRTVAGCDIYFDWEKFFWDPLDWKTAIAIERVVEMAGLIIGCSVCGLCEQVCPEKFSMQDLCLTAREEMVVVEFKTAESKRICPHVSSQ